MRKVWILILLGVFSSCNQEHNGKQGIFSIKSESVVITRWINFYDDYSFVYNMNSFDDNQIKGKWEIINTAEILFKCVVNDTLCACGEIGINFTKPLKIELKNTCKNNPFTALNLNRFEFSLYIKNQKLFKKEFPNLRIKKRKLYKPF